jgi:hypothetical protein
MRLAATLLLAFSSLAQIRPPSEIEQSAIQEVVHRAVVALNSRDVAAFEANTVSRFDVGFLPNPIVFANQNRTALMDLFRKPPKELASFQLATLVRTMRMLSNEVAFGEGFFRTINAPAGELAGRVNVTLVKHEDGWKLATARFTPYNFGNGPIFLPTHKDSRATPGPDGWTTLFDGSSLDAFTTASRNGLPPSWTVEDRLLRSVLGKGNLGLFTKDSYDNFELVFEWKVAPKGNSGIKYRIFYYSDRDATGHEYQVADDQGDPGAIQHPAERSGSLYNQIAPAKSVVKPAGEFNESRILVRGRHCEHWLNGEKVVEYEAESDPLPGPILIQHHNSEVWYRNIKIRRLTQ